MIAPPVFEAFARIAAATLFNSLWEAALVVAAVWAVLTLLPNVNATTRYAAWWVALIACFSLPLATAIPQITVQRAVHASHPSAAVAVPPRPARAATSQLPRAVGSSAPRTTQTIANAPPRTLRTRVTVPDIAAPIVFALWIVVASALLIRLALNLARLEALKRDALPVTVDFREGLPRWASAEKGGRDVRLCSSERIVVPVAVGLFDSMVLIPQRLLETLSHSDVDRITLHELAHLRRADDWTNGVQRLIQAIFFFNPAVLFVAQQLDIEREVACDDWVLRQTGEVRSYATCLTKMAEVTAWPHRALAAPGVFVTRRGLSVRVERLLRAGRNVRTSISFGPAGAVAASLLVLFVLAENVAPSFAFTLPAAVTRAEVRKPAQRPVANHHVANATTIAAAPAVPAKRSQPVVEYRDKVVYRPAPVPEPVAMHVAVRIAPSAIALAADPMTDCTGCTFRRAKLAGRDLRNVSLMGADFRGADLHGTDLSGANLEGADFREANLRSTNFTRANLEGCDMRGAALSGAVFDNANLAGCSIEISRLAPSQAGAILRRCEGCDFKDADLRSQDLRNVSVLGDNFSGADLRGADLTGSHFAGVDFRNVRLAGAKLVNATFMGCNFSGVDFRDVDTTGARFTGSQMMHAIMK